MHMKVSPIIWKLDLSCKTLIALPGLPTLIHSFSACNIEKLEREGLEDEAVDL